MACWQTATKISAAAVRVHACCVHSVHTRACATLLKEVKSILLYTHELVISSLSPYMSAVAMRLVKHRCVASPMCGNDLELSSTPRCLSKALGAQVDMIRRHICYDHLHVPHKDGLIFHGKLLHVYGGMVQPPKSQLADLTNAGMAGPRSTAASWRTCTPPTAAT